MHWCDAREDATDVRESPYSERCPTLCLLPQEDVTYIPREPNRMGLTMSLAVGGLNYVCHYSDLLEDSRVLMAYHKRSERMTAFTSSEIWPSMTFRKASILLIIAIWGITMNKCVRRLTFRRHNKIWLFYINHVTTRTATDWWTTTTLPSESTAAKSTCLDVMKSIRI